MNLSRKQHTNNIVKYKVFAFWLLSKTGMISSDHAHPMFDEETISAFDDARSQHVTTFKQFHKSCPSHSHRRPKRTPHVLVHPPSFMPTKVQNGDADAIATLTNQMSVLGLTDAVNVVESGTERSGSVERSGEDISKIQTVLIRIKGQPFLCDSQQNLYHHITHQFVGCAPMIVIPTSLGSMLPSW